MIYSLGYQHLLYIYTIFLYFYDDKYAMTLLELKCEKKKKKINFKKEKKKIGKKINLR